MKFVVRQIDEVTFRAFLSPNQALLIKITADLVDLLMRLNAGALDDLSIRQTGFRSDESQHLFSIGHVCLATSQTAAAPPTISEISCVMDACRALL